MATPRRLSELLFTRGMVGPSFAQAATSVTLMLLAEKFAIDWLVAPLVPALESALLSLGKYRFVLLASTLVFTVAFWGIGTLMALPAMLQVKRGKIQPNKSLDYAFLLRSMPLVVLNFVLGLALVPLAFFYLLPDHSFDFRSLPDTWTTVRHVLVIMAVEEIVFYHFHRLFHSNKRLYALVHKLHHTWTAPISYVAIYANPVEHVLCNLLPLVLGPALCGAHFSLVVVFVFLGLVHTELVHSGYWICDDNGMHDEHHAKFNVNYGVLGVLDGLYGTYRLPAGASGSATIEAKRQA